MTTYDVGRAIVCTIYRNGDNTYIGKRFVINPRNVKTLDSLLQNVTLKCHALTAVRYLATPTGGTKITDLDDIHDNAKLVAIENGPFKKIEYTEITNTAIQRPRPRLNFVDVQPVHHSRQYEVYSGKYRKVPIGALTVFVYANGREFESAHRITLNEVQKHRLDWMKFLDNVTERVNLLYGACKSMFKVPDESSEQWDKVTSIEELDNGRYYVAVGLESGGLKRINYGHRSRPSFHISPKCIRKLGANSNTSLKTNNGRKSRAIDLGKPRIYPPKHCCTWWMPSSVEDRFHAKPRPKSPQHIHTPLKYNKDYGGVYKARGERKETSGAQQVEDSPNLKVDLPVDMRRAEEVHDENIEDSKSRPPSRSDKKIKNRNTTPDNSKNRKKSEIIVADNAPNLMASNKELNAAKDVASNVKARSSSTHKVKVSNSKTKSNKQNINEKVEISNPQKPNQQKKISGESTSAPNVNINSTPSKTSHHQHNQHGTHKVKATNSKPKTTSSKSDYVVASNAPNLMASNKQLNTQKDVSSNGKGGGSSAHKIKRSNSKPKITSSNNHKKSETSTEPDLKASNKQLNTTEKSPSSKASLVEKQTKPKKTGSSKTVNEATIIAQKKKPPEAVNITSDTNQNNKNNPVKKFSSDNRINGKTSETKMQSDTSLINKSVNDNPVKPQHSEGILVKNKQPMNNASQKEVSFLDLKEKKQNAPTAKSSWLPTFLNCSSSKSTETVETNRQKLEMGDSRELANTQSNSQIPEVEKPLEESTTPSISQVPHVEKALNESTTQLNSQEPQVEKPLKESTAQSNSQVPKLEVTKDTDKLNSKPADNHEIPLTPSPSPRGFSLRGRSRSPSQRSERLLPHSD